MCLCIPIAEPIGIIPQIGKVVYTIRGGLLTPLTRVYPEWKVDSEFISEHLNDALGLDAKLSSHPIEVRCPDANQINQVRSECYFEI